MYGNDEISGTSAAAPIITAIFALMLYQFPLHDGNIPDLIRRLEDCLDPFVVNNVIGKRGQMCRIEGIINPSKALRKDLIGPYGIMEENELPGDVATQVRSIQDNIKEAERYKAIPFAIENLMGERKGKDMLDANRNEIDAYRSVLLQLNAIAFDNETAIKWKKFEIDRIEALLANNNLTEKDADLMNSFSNILNIAEVQNNENVDREDAIFLYECALQEVKEVFPELSANSFLRPLMTHFAFWIEERIKRLR